jgi:hypothetical protein
MMRLFLAELQKVRTTRLWVGLAIGGAGLVAVASIAVLAIAGTEQGIENGLGAITTVADVQKLVWSGAAMSFFAVVLAATMATGEFRYGTIGATYLATPRRADVIGSKLLAAIPLGAAYGLVGGVLPVAIGLGWFAAKGEALPFGGGVPIAVSEVVLQCAYGAALAVCIGAAIRSQLVAILGLLGWSFVVEPLASALVPDIKPWTPTTGVPGAFGAPDPHVFGHAAGAALMVLYVVGALAIAVWLERRRDV